MEELKAQGVAQEQIKLNDEYMKCLAAYNDFTSTLDEEQARRGSRKDIDDYGARIKEHKLQMQETMHEIED